MIKSFLIITIRNLLRYRAQSLINIIGLSVGIASFAIIFLYVQAELKYDRYHENYKRIYRIHNTIDLSDGTYTYPTCNSMLPVKAFSDIPEVENYTRFFRAGGGFGNPVIVEVEENYFKEDRAFFADSSTFGIFSFHFLEGDPRSALSEPNTTVITKTIANKYFAGESAIGKVIKVTGQQELQYKVTGVIKDVPEYSHFRFDLLLSVETARNIDGGEDFILSWENDGFYSYLLLDKISSRNRVEKELIKVTKAHVEEEAMNRHQPFLFPLRKIHLHSNLRNEIESNGNIQQIYVFIIVAIFIILIASVNYINLSTSVASRRAMEVGVRKVFGANKRHLIRQFLGESLFIALLSAILAPLLVELALPHFNVITGFPIEFQLWQNNELLLTLLGIVIFLGIVSGTYPAFILSSFKPDTAIKGRSAGGVNISERFRKTLVVFQFFISITLIIGTITIYRQINFLYNKSLGFNQKNLILVKNSNNTLTPKLKVFKEELLMNPSIKNVSASFSTPGGLRPIVAVQTETVDENEDLNLAGIFIDIDFMKTLEIPILEGRDFDPANATDSAQAIIINKKAIEDLCLGENPVGKVLKMNLGQEDIEKRIIGIVDNINFEPLYRPTEGAFYSTGIPFLPYVFVRVDGHDLNASIALLDKKWREFVPGEPFDYSVMEEDLKMLYSTEEKLVSVITYLSFLAIFIALLGLYGLSSYTISLRTKEIGIRKVLGASVVSILSLFSRQYLFLVILANLISWPLAWLLIDQWMNNFIYHVPIDPGLFIISGLVVTILALAVIFVKVIQVAEINPSVTLKYE